MNPMRVTILRLMNASEITLRAPLRVFGNVLVASLWVGSLSAQAPGSAMPDSVRAYVRDAMTIFRANSLHQAEVNWSALEVSVISRSGNAQTPDGTWRALTWALRSVDPHSFLMPPPSKMATMLGGIAAPSRAAEPAESWQSLPAVCRRPRSPCGPGRAGTSRRG